MPRAFLDLLSSGGVLVLDGALGTELQRRGVDTRLPLWSARALLSAPQVVRAIHGEYLEAGADVLTTNTFRTHRRSLAQGGLGQRARELTERAVQLAQEAVARHGRPAFVAGSIAPLEDCYSPRLVPSEPELEAEHGELAQHLAAAGCDLLLVETMNTAREAAAAAGAASATGLPVCVSFVVGAGGRAPGQRGQVDGEIRLLSGESLAEAVSAVQALAPAVLMVNCVPLADMDRALEALRAAWPGRTGLYANVGRPDPLLGWELSGDVQPTAYAAHVRGWRQRQACLLGGCCGTRPAHIAALAASLRGLDGESAPGRYRTGPWS